ncbi:MAG: Crp/Fnr family transcriptional regulator [Firmicutes bacterium]|nr:Crp/Fnr family transcriptional regulator [Bacillota bacterium]
MNLAEYFPVWNKLSTADQQRIEGAAMERRAEKGEMIHRGGNDCSGLVLIKSGQLRAYMLSEEGREVTLYRLFDYDICLFTASCIMQSIQFEIFIEVEKDAELIVIPAPVFKAIMDQSAACANYINEIMAARFSDVMWLVEQVMWKSMDKRLAAFLIEEGRIEESGLLALTHEKIANHMGTAREVVTRMLKYFQGEGLVKLSRGYVEITDERGLEELAE